MENINSLININNTIQNPKTGIVQNSNEQMSQQQTSQSQIQIQQQNQNINPSLLYDYSMAKMDNETVLKYLQNLLKMPETIEKFVNQLNDNSINSKLTSILIKNMISIKALNEFLNQNSTQAISKLLQTISTSLKSGVNDVNQLKEILSVLNTIQTNSSISNNTLKELLLLYIPLSAPIFNKESNFSNLDEDEEKAIKQSKLNILFETNNLSNILCTLNEIENNVIINIYCTSSFPKEEFAHIVELFSKETSINPMMEFKQRKKDENPTTMQNFKIISEGLISTNCLILSHLIIKTIFKLDNDLVII